MAACSPVQPHAHLIGLMTAAPGRLVKNSRSDELPCVPMCVHVSTLLQIPPPKHTLSVHTD